MKNEWDNMPYEEATARNKILMEISAIDVNGGRMLILDPTDEAKIIELNNKICARFNLFKRLIQTGEYTFFELVDHISDKYAAKFQKTPKVNFSNDKSFDEFVKFCENNIRIMEEKQFLESQKGGSFKDIFSQIFGGNSQSPKIIPINLGDICKKDEDIQIKKDDSFELPPPENKEKKKTSRKKKDKGI